jgi:hypothetical protein
MFLVLDWLALDDITTGNESSLLGEYVILAISIPLFIILGYIWKSEKPNS